MKVMDIDCLVNETVVTIKDMTKQQIHTKSYYHERITRQEVLETIYELANCLGVEQIYIDITAYGMAAYNYLSATDFKDRIIPFKYKNMIPASMFEHSSSK